MESLNVNSTTTPDQAVILAGGQATRMRPYTENAPKAMVPVAGVPIIAYQLLWLAEYGVKSVVVSVGYMSEVITDYVDDGSRFGVDVTYAKEDEPLGRGGGLKFAAQSLQNTDRQFFALNGDLITKFSLTHLAAQHQQREASVTIALAPYRSNWGVADLDGDLVRGFTQSPSLPYWINAGVYVFAPDVVKLLPDKGDHEDSTFPKLAADGRLVGYKVNTYWRGVDTVKDVKEVSLDIQEQGYALPEAFRSTN